MTAAQTLRTTSRRAPLRVTLGCGMLAAVGAVAAETPAQAAPDRAVFDQLKSLEGRWVGQVKDAPAAPVAVEIEVTSNGRAVLEKLFADTDHEMTTVYFLAGDRLQATHYCSIGNQPTLSLASTSTPRDIVLELSGGTGFDPKVDQHAHGVQIKVLDSGQLDVAWQFRKGETAPTYARMLLARAPEHAPPAAR